MHDTWKSKKLWFGVGAIVAMFKFALIAALWIPPMLPLFDGFVGGVVGVTGIVIAGNIANKVAVGKVQQKLLEGQPVEPGPEDNPEDAPQEEKSP